MARMLAAFMKPDIALKRNESRSKLRDSIERLLRAGYQLDLVTPGMYPFEASSRKAMRESLKRPM